MRERATAEKRGHSLFAMMGQLTDEIGDIDRRALRESSGQRTTPTVGGTARKAGASP